MTKLLLTICLLMSTAAAAYSDGAMNATAEDWDPTDATIYDATTIGNLTIKIRDGHQRKTMHRGNWVRSYSEDWLKVYKDGKLVLLEENCTRMCEIYIVKSESFDFKFEYGLVKADGKTAFNLHPDNIEIFKTGWFNQNEVIGFVQSTTNAIGEDGNLTIYTIDIDSGDVSTLYKEINWFTAKFTSKSLSVK